MMTSSNDPLIISDHEMLIYNWAVWGVTCQITNIFGMVTNIINIICFTKQGFKDSVNISLLGLSISDLGSLTTMTWTCICLTPAILQADLSFDPVDTMYLTSAMAHFSFTRISSCITAMITLERCLCITSPLKIKSIITPRRTTVVTICIFLICFCSAAPVYAVNRLGMRFYLARNKTLLGMISTEDREYVEQISFVINNFTIPSGAFVIIVVCTTTLAFTLLRKTKWRQQTTSSAQGDRVSNRNQKTAKMVVMISSLFITCFVPVSIAMLAVACTPELSIHGKYINLALMMGGLGYVMENINSSVNIFIYYRMSSKYRDNFRQIFYITKTMHK